jgi:hypothetical protein
MLNNSKDRQEKKGLFLGKRRHVLWGPMPCCMGQSLRSQTEWRSRCQKHACTKCCLLLQFYFKTLHQNNIPWKTWVTSLSPFPLSQGLNSTFLGKTIHKNLATLRDITQCKVGNGLATFFWLDRWLLHEPLAQVFPAIFSHHQSPYAFISDFMRTD